MEPKILRLLEPQGEPEVIECDGKRYLPERTCQLEHRRWDDGQCTWGCVCTACDAHLEHETGIGYKFCPICGAKVVE